MGLPKSKNAVGLGNSLMNDRFGKGKGADRKKVSAGNKGVVRVNHATGEEYVTNAAQEASWVKMRSVTEQGALDEFLSTAELAGTDFTAEKMNNVKIIHTDQRNPYLLSAAEERGVRRKQAQNRGRLTVPRRPKWDETTTPQELDEMERAALLDWRRGLAELQENNDLLMTPFERNIEVWRQLWRVIERSDLVVQIVDARNPLMFRSDDLEKYVREVDSRKRNLLLVNKADMMTEAQREQWADYFEKKRINYKFFSAHLAKELNGGRGDAEDVLDDVRPTERDQTVNGKKTESGLVENVRDLNLKHQQEMEDDDDDDEESGSTEEDDDEEEEEDEEDSDESEEASEDEDELSSDDQQPFRQSSTSSSARTQILTVDELEALFLENIPTASANDGDESTIKKTTIGLVGYPNVGKSSTINALIGAKKVSVSATPGKTKHFQTIHLSPNVILCDCPGLVFPNFATTKAELVCNGVLPIDQLREFSGPAGLVAHRIPKTFLENVYGMQIRTRPVEEGGTGIPTASEMLRAYARARGFATSGRHGAPDESRAARYVLKDYVNGKLLYCHPPPSLDNPLEEGPIDGKEFNMGLYDFAHLPAKRQAWLLSHTDTNEDTSSFAVDNATDNPSVVPPSSTTTQNAPGLKSRTLDSSFFKSQQQAQAQASYKQSQSQSSSAAASKRGNEGHISSHPFNAAYTPQGQAMMSADMKRSLLTSDGKELTGRKEKMMLALERGVDVSDLNARTSKKHFKTARRKVRSGKKVGVEDDE